jgi:hypothetical protein
VSPVRYDLGFYIPEDTNLHSHRREDLKSYYLRNVSYQIDSKILVFSLDDTQSLHSIRRRLKRT